MSVSQQKPTTVDVRRFSMVRMRRVHCSSRIVVSSDGYQYMSLLHAALFIGQPVT